VNSRLTTVLLLVWLALGAVLAGVLAVAWLQTARLKAFLADVQAWYAVSQAPAPWWLRSDSHLHALCACGACLWFALGLRLFTRVPPLVAIPLTVLLVLSDEIAQLFSGERDFEWSDQFSDATGILVAGVLVWRLLQRHTRPQTTP
jgi:hypothetical protein